jgi:hypothetical protein
MTAKQDLIGYCGLCCADCPGHTQTAANLAEDLRKQLEHDHFEKMAVMLKKVPSCKEFRNYDKFYNLLCIMTKLRCNKLCRSNSIKTKCKIRSCARKKGLDGCWQCDDFPTCKKLKDLEPHHGAAHLKNLRKLKRYGQTAFLKGKRYWYADK